MQPGAWSRRLRICIADLEIKRRSWNSLGLELVEVQETGGMITSYLAGTVLLQFTPFGGKRNSESSFELDWWTLVCGTTSMKSIPS